MYSNLYLSVLNIVGNKMDKGLARVTSTSILVIGVLIIIFATGGTGKNYATVNFEGGYTKIGIIYSERIDSEAKITINGDTLVEGDINDIISWIQDNSDSSSTWKKGVTLNASTSIEWVASRQNFSLNTDNYSITSDGTLPALKQVSVLEKMLLDAKSRRESIVSSSLSFSKDPNAGLISQLTSLLK